MAEDIEITVISVDGHRVRLGIKAPRSIRVLRAEVDDSIAASNQTAAIKLQTADNDILKLVAKARIQKKSS